MKQRISVSLNSRLLERAKPVMEARHCDSLSEFVEVLLREAFENYSATSHAISDDELDKRIKRRLLHLQMQKSLPPIGDGTALNEPGVVNSDPGACTANGIPLAALLGTPGIAGTTPAPRGVAPLPVPIASPSPRSPQPTSPRTKP